MLAKSSFFLRHKRKIAFLLILGVFIALGLIVFRKSRKSINTTFASNRESYTVTKGNITSSITGSGTIGSSNTKNIASEVSADVLVCNVKVGDKVSKGDILFELDKSSLDSQIRKQEKTISSAQKNVSSYKEDLNNLYVYAPTSGYISNFNGKLGDDINKNSSLLSISNTDNYFMECYFYYNSSIDIEVGNTVSVFIANTLNEVKGTVSYVSEYKEVSSEGTPMLLAEITIPNPGYSLNGISALPTVYTATKAIKGIEYGTIKEDNVLNVKSESSGTISILNFKNGDFVEAGELLMVLSNDDLKDNLSDAQTTLSDAYEDLNDINDTYDFYTITAPIDGIVTAVNVAVDDYVRSESVLATIVNTSDLEFSISVDELDISDVEIGQEVKITVDALEETEKEPLIGRVSEIALEGSSMNSVTTYPVTISLSGDDSIKIGFNCSSEIVISSAEDVIVVPVEAINSRRGKYYVTLEDMTEKEVTVGMYDEDNIEIKSGLEVGDIILLPEKVASTSTEEATQMPGGNMNFPGGGMPGMNMGGGMPSMNGGGNRDGNMRMPGGF